MNAGVTSAQLKHDIGLQNAAVSDLSATAPTTGNWGADIKTIETQLSQVWSYEASIGFNPAQPLPAATASALTQGEANLATLIKTGQSDCVGVSTTATT